MLIKDSWMKEERIILLVKLKMYDEAIKMFLDEKNPQFE